MNERDLDLALDRLGAQHVRRTAPPALRERVRTVPTETPQRRFWLPHIDTGGFTMFSAVRFIAAAVIVALFGGFLLTGVLTTPQGDEVIPAAVTETPLPDALTASPKPKVTGEPTDATVRTDVLPGVTLTVDEVEPGVVRVLSDGVHEFSWPVEPGDPKYYFPDTDPPGFPYWYSAPSVANVVANDEGVWLGSPGGIVRLGEEGFAWPNVTRFEVAPDGTLYQGSRSRILGEDGWSKVSPPRMPGFHSRSHILFAPDGSLWVKGTNGKEGAKSRTQFARRNADGWSIVEVPLPRPEMRSWPGIADWEATDDGVLYVRRGTEFLQRYDGTVWETLPSPDGGIGNLHVGLDGTVWVRSRHSEGEVVFHRLDADGSGWTTHEVGVEHPLTALHGWEGGLSYAAGPNGAIWFAPGGGERENGSCDGVARYDGTTTTRFLRDLCVYDIAFGPGGDAWVLAGDWRGSIWDSHEVGPVEPYVITSVAQTTSSQPSS